MGRKSKWRAWYENDGGTMVFSPEAVSEKEAKDIATRFVANGWTSVGIAKESAVPDGALVCVGFIPTRTSDYKSGSDHPVTNEREWLVREFHNESDHTGYWDTCSQPRCARARKAIGS